MFELVEVDGLKINQIYKIDTYSFEYKGRLKCVWEFDEDEIYVEFDRLYNSTMRIYFDNLYFLYDHNIYQFVSDNPQWNMERRAVNKIVRRLIGDDCFEW
jgi:hypothetical protein